MRVRLQYREFDNAGATERLFINVSDVFYYDRYLRVIHNDGSVTIIPYYNVIFIRVEA